jgi:hypothetical protein
MEYSYLTKKIKMNLYAFYLGGKAVGQNGIAAMIEAHDVVFAVGETVEDCYDQCRQQWFGIADGLHTDAYIKLQHIDGYEISLTVDKVEYIFYGENTNLYFVYLGASAHCDLSEEHRSLFMIADSLEELKLRAKSQQLYLINLHIDSIKSITCVSGYNIRLSETNLPDKLDVVASYVNL